MKQLFSSRRRSSKVNTKSNATKANDDSTEQPQTPRLTSKALEQLENDTTLPLPTYSNSTSNTPPSLLSPTQQPTLNEISKLLQDNLHIRTIKLYHFITYKNCFLGSELIDYLIEEHIALDRDEGINIGYKLLNYKRYLRSGEKERRGGGGGGIECVSNSMFGGGGSCDEFKDGYVLYRFKRRQGKKQKTTTLDGL